MPRLLDVSSGLSSSSTSSAQILQDLGNARPSNDNGSFIHKPPRGWLHPDELILNQGMRYGVRYVGCMEINTSMKSLDFETRSMIAKECINRVCEVAGLKTTDKHRKVDKRISHMLASNPNMEHAGSNVTLTISSDFLNLVILESGENIAKHEMPNISFASGGDADTLDFVAYVAKDHLYGRACFILECGGGLAQDVITTIGQAFELRFKEFLQTEAVDIPTVPLPTSGAISTSKETRQKAIAKDHSYYNDVPPPVPPLPTSFTIKKKNLKDNSCNIGNLIDLTSDLPGTVTKKDHNYVNEIPHVTTTGNKKKKDSFDMQPFTQALGVSHSNNAISRPRPSGKSKTKTAVVEATADSHEDKFSHRSYDAKASKAVIISHDATNLCKNKIPFLESSNMFPKEKNPLLKEPWFHSTISRKDSEALVEKDGDFLVRESLGSAGQYVLTGMQGGIRKHLLLVDPEGVVRTKDRTFESVSHLIHYHCDNGLPIISAESALILKQPVERI